MSTLLRLVFSLHPCYFNWRRECNQSKAVEKENKMVEEASDASGNAADKANGSIEHVEDDEWFTSHLNCFEKKYYL